MVIMFIKTIFKDSKIIIDQNAIYICIFWFCKTCWFLVKKWWCQQKSRSVSRDSYTHWMFFRYGITAKFHHFKYHLLDYINASNLGKIAFKGDRRGAFYLSVVYITVTHGIVLAVYRYSFALVESSPTVFSVWKSPRVLQKARLKIVACYIYTYNYFLVHTLFSSAGK